MKDLRKIVVVAGAEQHFLLLSNFVIAVITARLMSANEIGIALVGTAIITIFVALREYATPMFLIKEGHVPIERLNGPLTANLCTCVALSTALVLSAPLIASLYAEPRLAPFLRVMAMGLMFEALYLPVVAVMRREMAFDQAGYVSVAAAVTIIVATTMFARAGWGYMSFCWGTTIGHLAGAVVAGVMRPRFWWIRPSTSSWRELYIFGRANGTNTILRQLSEAMPYLVLGHILPSDAVAYFHRALMLSQLPGKLLLSGVETIMLPHLSAQLREKRNIKSSLLKTFECLTAVYWPSLLMLALLADPIVRLLYGPNWAPVVPIVHLLAIASLFTFVGKIDVSVLLATGGLGGLLRMSLIIFPLCGAIAVGAAMFGVYALASSYFLIRPIQLLTSISVIRRYVRFTWRELAHALTKSAVVTIVSFSVPVAVVATYGLPGTNPVLIAGIVAGGLFGWLGAIWLTRHTLFVQATSGIAEPLDERVP